MDLVELRTPPPETITVTDYEFVLEGGIGLAVVLKPGDKIDESWGDGTQMVFNIADPEETIIVELNKVLYSTYRRRQVQVDRPASPPAASAAIPPTAVSRPRPAIDSLQVLPD